MYTEKMKRLEEYAIPTIRMYIEWGWLMPLETMIPLYRKCAIKSGRQDIIDLFDKFDRWLQNAQMLEDTHGVGSLFRHDHPDIVAARTKRLSFLAKKQLKRKQRSNAVHAA